MKNPRHWVLEGFADILSWSRNVCSCLRLGHEAGRAGHIPVSYGFREHRISPCPVESVPT